MSDFWKTAIKASPPVGIVGFLFYFFMNKIFSPNVIQLFGSNGLFILAIIICCGLLICLLSGIIAFFQHAKRESVNPKVNHAIFKDSSIQGDVVLGDKIINRDDK